MTTIRTRFDAIGFAVNPTSRTRHADLLLLCARIGYSPPAISH